MAKATTNLGTSASAFRFNSSVSVCEWKNVSCNGGHSSNLEVKAGVEGYLNVGVLVAQEDLLHLPFPEAREEVEGVVLELELVHEEPGLRRQQVVPPVSALP